MRICNITYFCDFVIKPGVDLPFMLGSEKVTPLFWTWEGPGVKAGTSCLNQEPQVEHPNENDYSDQHINDSDQFFRKAASDQ
nr:unnamed protein product [Callosobruchus chinensis]